MSEHLEQVELVSWFRKEYPQYKIYAVANGGKRGIREAVRLKAEGVLRGVSDLHVPELRLWLEMKKDKKGRLSKEQREWGGYVESFGDKFIVGFGFEDARDKVLHFMKESGYLPHAKPRTDNN